VSDQAISEQQSWEVADCFFDLFGSIVSQAERLAQRLSVPVPFIKALHTLECPMAMKELGKRLHCDPSFVTLVTDMLETRGLARREPHPADRRVKNIVLTEDGLALKSQIDAELRAGMPWNKALSDEERTQFLGLIRKMLASGAGDADAMPGPITSLLVNALHEHAPHTDAGGSSQASTGGGDSPVSGPSAVS
jgi:DNA-binding MarR family transcriptional regulator